MTNTFCRVSTGLLNTRSSLDDQQQQHQQPSSRRSMTPDQINVDALLASQDYLQATQTDDMTSLSAAAAAVQQPRASLDATAGYNGQSQTFGEMSGLSTSVHIRT